MHTRDATLIGPADDEIDPLDQLAEEYLERLRRGDRPSVEDFARRLPDQSGEVRDLLEALRMVEGLKPGDEPTPRETGWAGKAGGPPPIDRLGDYRILREIGRGGMGVVFEAEQISLGRHVALKVLAASATRSGVQVQRFLREAQSAARLHHTNIVPVFGVGDQDGHFYYAMQYIPGLGLDKVLEEIRRRKRPADRVIPEPPTDEPPADPTEPLRSGEALPPIAPAQEPRPAISLPGDVSLADASGSGGRYTRGVAKVGVQVAEALEYAHQRGTLHRDIKPSNLLLDLKGNVWVADFGLAKVSEGDELTRTGDLVGTLRYMAPERFEGRCDARSDVHALGLTLYEMLALRPAFDAADRHGLIFEMTRREPPRIRDLVPGIPRDLETIIQKAIEREPAHRYASAGSMSADLRAFLEHRPIEARRVSSTERLTRWARRNPGLATLGSAVAVLLSLTVVVIAVAYARLSEKSAQVIENLGRAEEAEKAVVHELVESSLARVQAQRRSGQIGRRFAALRVLERAVRRDRGGERLTECRNEAIACLALADLDPAPIAMDRVAAMPVGIDIDPDRDRVALALPDGGIVVRSLADGREFARFDGDGMPSARIRFSPDGRFLAAKAERNGRSAFRVVDIGTGRRILDVAGGAFQAAFDFHPSLPIVAAGRRDGSILFYDLGTGEERSRLEPGAVPWAIRFDPSGQRLAVISPRSDEALQVRDANDGRLLAAHREPERARVVDWHPDGRWLAAAGEDGRIHLIDTEGRPRRILEGHGGPVVELAHHPEGGLLASTGEDGTIRLWDIPTGRELVRGPAHRHHRLRFSRDGSILGPGDDGSTPCLWKLEAGREFSPLLASDGPGRPIRSIEPLVDSPLLAAASDDGIRFSAGGIRAAEALARMPGTTSAISSTDGRFVVSAGSGGLLRWPVSRRPDGSYRVGPPEPFGQGPGHPTTRLALSKSGATLAAALDDERGRILILDLTGGRPPIELTGHSRAEYVDVSPDGLAVATGTREGDGVKLWDARTGEILADLFVPGAANVAFSPDGRRLLTCEGPQYRLWDLATHSEVWRLHRDQAGDLPGHAAFRRDGRMLAVAGTRNIVRLIDPADGEIVASLEPSDPREITGLAFEADGNLLVLSPGVDAVRRWDLCALRLGLDALGLGRADLAPGPRIETSKGVAPAVIVEPAPWLGPIERGDRAILAGRWDEAAASYREAIDAGAPNVDPWTRLALIAAASGDGPAYREACSRLLARFRGVSPVPKVANNVAWTCALAPSALDDYDDAHNLAFGAASGDREPSRWNTVGAVLYRAGRLDEAIRQLNHSVESHGAGGTPYDALFLAMAHHRSGHPSMAASWFERALRPGPAAMRKPDVSGPSSWIPGIELELLRREAIALFGKPAP